MDLFVARVCVCVCVCVCVPALSSGSLMLNALVRTYVLALCFASLVLHAAARTYCSPFCACDVSPRVCECVRVLRQSGAECDCADLFGGPLPWQSGAACGCADLFVTCLRV